MNIMDDDIEALRTPASAYAEYLSRAVVVNHPLDASVDRQLRELLWIRHGCSLGALYGDDGEMQCNACFPMLDFKRDSWERILDGISKHDASRFARQHAAVEIAVTGNRTEE